MISEPFFVTDRLTVYRTEAPHGFDESRWIFNAIAHDGDPCGVTVTAVVGTASDGRPFLWWIETSIMLRRHGYATELVRAITKRYPTIVISPGSADGDHFVAHWKRLCDTGAAKPTGTVAL